MVIKGHQVGIGPDPRITGALTYSSAVAMIGFCIIFTPKYIRPSYMAMANRICGNKLHLLNRCLVILLFPDAIEGYEDCFANLDPQFMSNKFKETVLSWLLECKDYN